MPRSRRSWRSWHLVALFALGSVLEWAGERLREWAGAKLKARWFDDGEGDGDGGQDDDEAPT